MDEQTRKNLAECDHDLTAVEDRLRSLSVGASQLFQTGLANELESLRSMVCRGRAGTRYAVDALESARFKDAEQASANVVNTALSMAKAAFGASDEVT